MAFTEETVKKAWNRADGKCECNRASHEHSGRCSDLLVWGNRGREGLGAWEAHHKDGNSNNDSLANCEILCWECHEEIHFGAS